MHPVIDIAVGVLLAEIFIRIEQRWGVKPRTIFKWAAISIAALLLLIFWAASVHDCIFFGGTFEWEMLGGTVVLSALFLATLNKVVC